MITFLPINNHWSSHFAQKACVNTERVPPGHPMILLKSNKLNMAAVSVKRSIGHKNYFLVTSYNTSCDVCTIIERRNVMSGITWQQDFWITTIFLDRDSIYIVKWCKKGTDCMGYDGLLFCFWVQSGTGMSYMSIFSFFSAIFAGPRFIDFQEFC